MACRGQQQRPTAVRRRWRLLNGRNLMQSAVFYALFLFAIAILLGNYRLAPLGKCQCMEQKFSLIIKCIVVSYCNKTASLIVIASYM